MNRVFIRVVCLLSVFLCGLTNFVAAFAPFPVLLFGGGLPSLIFGSGISKGVQKALQKVNVLAKFVTIFLCIIGTVFLVGLVIWTITLVINLRSKRKIKTAISLLHRVQSDEMALYHGAQVSSELKQHIDLSKQEALQTLLVYIQDPFFLKKLGPLTHQRLIHSLTMIEQGNLSHEGQLIFLDQWVKVIQFLQN